MKTLSRTQKSVTSNTQELAKDTWPRPLSGKKFKGPESVCKHRQQACREDGGVEEVAAFVTTFSLVPSARLCLRPSHSATWPGPPDPLPTPDSPGPDALRPARPPMLGYGAGGAMCPEVPMPCGPHAGPPRPPAP